MIKYLSLPLLLLIFASNLTIAQGRPRDVIDTSECFLAHPYIATSDFLLVYQEQKEQNLVLRFTVYRYFSSCYDLGVTLKAGDNTVQLKKLRMVQDHSTFKDKTALFNIYFPAFEFQSLCVFTPQKDSSTCQLIFRVYERNTLNEIQRVEFSMEAHHYFFKQAQTVATFAVQDVQRYLFKYRSELQTQELANSTETVASPMQITAHQNMQTKIDPYFPIKMKLSDSRRLEISNNTIYNSSTPNFQSFMESKSIYLEFVNYPTKEILKTKKGESFSLNSTELISRNSTQISLSENSLYFTLDESFDLVQEILLWDEAVTIQMFLRVRYSKGEYFSVERLPFYIPPSDNDKSDFKLKFEKYIALYLIPIVIGLVIFIAFAMSGFALRKLLKQKKLSKDGNNLNILRSNSNENNKQMILNKQDYHYNNKAGDIENAN